MAERFQDNAAAFTEALGVKHAPTVVWLSMVPWQNVEDRSEFIRMVTGRGESRAFTEQRREQPVS